MAGIKRFFNRLWWWITRRYIAGEDIEAGQVVYRRGRKFFVCKTVEDTPPNAFAFSDSHAGDAVKYATSHIVGNPEAFRGLMTGREASLKLYLDGEGRLIVDGSDDEQSK